MTYLLGIFKRWLLLGFLALPAKIQGFLARRLGQWLSPTYQGMAFTLSDLAHQNEQHPAFQFSRRAIGQIHPRSIHQFSKIFFHWLNSSRRKRATDQKWQQCFPAFLTLDIVPPQANGAKPTTQKHLDGSLLNNLIHECKDNGTYIFELTGTEPLRHPQILTLIERHSDALFLIHSQGKMLSDLVLKQLIKTANVFVWIHMAGFSSETDAILGPQAHENAMAAMKRLKEMAIPFGVNLITRADNYRVVTSNGYVEQLMEQGSLSLKYDLYIPQNIEEAKQLLNTAELLEVVKRTIDIRNIYPILALEPTLETCQKMGCSAQLGLSLHISYQGFVHPCRHIPFADHRLGEGRSLREIANRQGLLKDLRSKRMGHEKSCYFVDHPQLLLNQYLGVTELDGQIPATKGSNSANFVEILENLNQMNQPDNSPDLLDQYYQQDQYKELSKFIYESIVPQ